MDMKIVVLLPTYNEKDNIVVLLDRLHEECRQIAHHEIIFLVVDDTSPDGTAEVVKKYQEKHKDVRLLSGKKQGLGKALLNGMKHAVDEFGADAIVQMDADLSHDPAVVPQFIKKIDEGADFVVGSRYIPGGSIPQNWGLHRKIFSVVGNAIVRYGLGFPKIHDWTGGYRAYKRKFYEAAKDELASFRGYVFQIAYLHKSVRRGAKIVEVPIQFTDRKFGRSKIAPSEYIRDVLGYVISERIRDIYNHQFFRFCVVGGIGFVVNTIVLELFVFLGFHPALGSSLGAECAIISNYILNNAWSFRAQKHTGKKFLTKFFQFNSASVGAIVIQGGTVWLGTHLYGVASYRGFYILGVGLGLIWNYVMYSRVIWKKNRK